MRQYRFTSGDDQWFSFPWLTLGAAARVCKPDPPALATPKCAHTEHRVCAQTAEHIAGKMRPATMAVLATG